MALTRDGPVGVDPEPLDCAVDASLREIVLDPEDPTTADPAPDLPTVWVRKEAVLEATGEGLSCDPSAIWVSASRAPAVFVKHTGRPELRCRLSDLDVPGYRAALAVVVG